MTPRRLAVGAVALAIVGPIAGAGNFVFHAMASRSLGPDGYGGLNALLAVTVAVAVPAAAVQMTLARSLLSGVVSAGRMRYTVSAIAVGVGAATVLASPLVAVGLRLGSPLPVVLLVGYLMATIVGLVPKAVLVAQERLGALAAGTLLGVIVRLTIGAALLRAGGDLTAAVAAGSVGEIVATAFFMRVTATAYADVGGSIGGWRSHVGPVLGFGGLWALLAVDVAASRVVMDGTAAGAYGAAAVLARAILFLPQSVATAAFSRLADPLSRPRALSWATAAALTLSVAGVCGLAVFGGGVATVLFGAGFDVDRRVVIVLGAGAALMSVANIWVHARVAYGQPAGLRMVGAVGVAMLGALPAAHASATALAWWMVGAAGVALWLVRPRSAVAVPFPDPSAVPAPPSLDVSIVLPAFNAAGSIGPHLRAVEAVLASTGRTYEVLVVDDGSADDTAAEARCNAGRNSRVLGIAHRGKGGALLAGMAEARGRLVGFIDGDGNIAAGVLRQLIDAVAEAEVDGAIAVKGTPGSRGLLRRLTSAGFRVVVRGSLALDVSDTQTGAKVFRSETVAAVLPWLTERGFAWDAEFLAASRRLGFGPFVQVPVDGVAPSRSLRPGALWSMLRATLRVSSRVAMLPSYEPALVDPSGRPVPGRESHPGVPTCIRTVPGPRLRVLILNWKCHKHPDAGGAEVYTREVARRWAATGHDVTVFAAAVADEPGEELVDGYRVHRRGDRMSVYREARAFWYERRDDFDVIVDEVNTRPFEAPLWADVPVVAWFHQLARDVWFHELPVPVAAAGRYVLEPLWIRSYRDVPVVTVSESSAASLRAVGLGRVVNVGVGSSIGDEHTSHIPGMKSSLPSVAFVGRMVPAKRPFDALTAFALARRELGEGELVLMGDGPIAAAVSERARRLPGAVFLGRVSEEEKSQQLSAAHALVVTSVREGWGLVVDEAAALGAHPIGYRVPGLVDSIPAAGGTLVDPNPDALAAALVERLPRLVREPAVARRGGARSWDDVAERLLTVVATAARPLDRV